MNKGNKIILIIMIVVCFILSILIIKNMLVRKSFDKYVNMQTKIYSDDKVYVGLRFDGELSNDANDSIAVEAPDVYNELVANKGYDITEEEFKSADWRLYNNVYEGIISYCRITNSSGEYSIVFYYSKGEISIIKLDFEQDSEEQQEYMEDYEMYDVSDEDTISNNETDAIPESDDKTNEE